MSDPVDTPPGIAAVLRELDAIHATIRDNREDVKAELLAHREVVKEEMAETRAEVNEKLDDIVTEARKTNGRLKKAELWIAAVKGVLAVAVVVGVPLGLKLIDHL